MAEEVESWVEKHDARSGRTYYGNLLTLETTWMEPAPVARWRSGSVDEEYVERQDAKSKRAYYQCRRTNSTTWIKPLGKIVPSVAADEDTTWVECVDTQSQRTYYFNAGSGRTTWQRPASDAIIKATLWQQLKRKAKHAVQVATAAAPEPGVNETPDGKKTSEALEALKAEEEMSNEAGIGAIAEGTAAPELNKANTKIEERSDQAEACIATNIENDEEAKEKDEEEEEQGIATNVEKDEEAKAKDGARADAEQDEEREKEEAEQDEEKDEEAENINEHTEDEAPAPETAAGDAEEEGGAVVKDGGVVEGWLAVRNRDAVDYASLFCVLDAFSLRAGEGGPCFELDASVSATLSEEVDDSYTFIIQVSSSSRETSWRLGMDSIEDMQLWLEALQLSARKCRVSSVDARDGATPEPLAVPDGPALVSARRHNHRSPARARERGRGHKHGLAHASSEPAALAAPLVPLVPLVPTDESFEAWAEAHGFQQHIGAFHDAGYDDLALLAELTDVDLKEMLSEHLVLTKPGHRMKVVLAVRRLRGPLGFAHPQRPRPLASP